MSAFYRVLYQVGFTPWEEGLAQRRVAEEILTMFDRVEAGRQRDFGRALDLGCGTGIHAVTLASRGWDVTGIDLVPKAIDRARERAAKAGVTVRFILGDVTDLQAAGIDGKFQLILDFGTVHGLTVAQRIAVGRSVTGVAAPDATLLMLSFKRGRRWPLPHGLTRAEIEATYPGWTITDEFPQNAELPPFLKKLHADPCWYQLSRK